ncbi:MAG: quinolinate synthase NadA [Myxococcales bacterium]|nr:MAG: quinolinate synthase NadA [Myxococcales bacterium]
MAIDIRTAVQAAAGVAETLTLMKQALKGVVSEAILEDKAELVFAINRLKREKRAVILGHNYMEPALYQTIPDHVGDSLELSRIAAKTDADIIVFCGVRFMAETAKILNPKKLVLLPSDRAGCSLAAAITGDDVRALKRRFKGAPVVSYVNTYADVKAETDICCTSSNAAEVVQYLLDRGHKRVIFLPDEYLGTNVAHDLGLPIFFPDEADPGHERALIGWRGRCEVHEQFTVADVQQARSVNPNVVVLAHPECSRPVVEAADFSGSTKQMIRYVKENNAPEFLLLTECSMGDNIVAENPDKNLLRLCSVRCPHMKQITLEDTYAALVHLRHRIELDADTIERSRASLERMIAIGGGAPVAASSAAPAHSS